MTGVAKSPGIRCSPIIIFSSLETTAPCPAFQIYRLPFLIISLNVVTSHLVAAVSPVSPSFDPKLSTFPFVLRSAGKNETKEGRRGLLSSRPLAETSCTVQAQVHRGWLIRLARSSREEESMQRTQGRVGIKSEGKKVEGPRRSLDELSLTPVN